jgi:pimeloyl-ACP methyl ester carboxylesterase
VEESETYWAKTFDNLRRVKTTILHGEQDSVIAPEGSKRFANELFRRNPSFPLALQLIPGDHRLSGPEHLELFRRLVMREV